MGAAILWSYINLFGTGSIRKVAVFTAGGPASQRWAQSVIAGATLLNYTSAEQGDHFLMFKNPVKFAADLNAFLTR